MTDMDEDVVKDSKNFIIDKDARTIYLYTRVTSHITLAITKFINHANSVDSSDMIPIKIYINSSGGDTSGILGLVQVMISSKIPVYTYCMDIAASAAFLIFISGQTRTMVHGSYLMWHTLKSHMSAPDISSFRQRFTFTIHEQDDFDKIISSRSSIPMSKLAVLRDKSGVDAEMWLDTSEAESYNCVDAIYDY